LVRRWCTSAALGAALVSITACADFDPAPGAAYATPSMHVPRIALPLPTGVHRVGRLAFRWTDEARRRTLPVWIYYPAAVRDSTLEPVLNNVAWRSIHLDELSARLGPAAAQSLSGLNTSATTNAIIEPAIVHWPVLLFAPGRGALPTDYSAIIEEIASRGFVVVAFAPPGDGAAVLDPDGTLEAPGEPSVDRLAADFSFVHHELLLLNRDRTWNFAGQLDLAHVAVSGHGSGGSAALLAAVHDTALVAAVSLDGDFPAAVARGGIRQPFLYLSAEPPGLDSLPAAEWARADRAERRRQEFWDDASSGSIDALHARVAGMYDGNIPDAGLLPAYAVPVMHHQTRVGSINPRRAFVLTGTIVAQFVTDAITRSRRGAEAITAEFPEVVLER
jgi:predicted dienelactone hydrolase